MVLIIINAIKVPLKPGRDKTNPPGIPTKRIQEMYPLVNVYIAMQNHHVLWAINNFYGHLHMLLYQRVSNLIQFDQRRRCFQNVRRSPGKYVHVQGSLHCHVVVSEGGKPLQENGITFRQFGSAILYFNSGSFLRLE